VTLTLLGGAALGSQNDWITEASDERSKEPTTLNLIPRTQHIRPALKGPTPLIMISEAALSNGKNAPSMAVQPTVAATAKQTLRRRAGSTTALPFPWFRSLYSILSQQRYVERRTYVRRRRFYRHTYSGSATQSRLRSTLPDLCTRLAMVQRPTTAGGSRKARPPMLGGVAKPRLAATLLIGAFFPFFRRPLARRDTARRRWTLRNTAIPKPFRTSTEMSGDPPRGGALGSHIETTHWRL